MRTWETVSTLIDNTPVVNPPAVATATCYRIFWLVPAEAPGGHVGAEEVAVSVSEAFPSQRWDRRSNQFIWGPESSKWARDPGEPITVGVARVSLQLLGGIVMGQENQHAITAVVSFGLLRPPNCSPIRYPLWCSLARDDGGLTLEQHFASPPVIGDKADFATLLLEEGLVLHASAVPTEMSKCKYDMISLWATREGPGEIDADMDERVVVMDIPAKMPSWSLTHQRRN